jgi:hypothetical protein
MIEGLTITISGTELKTLCEEKAANEKEKSALWRTSEERLKKLFDKLADGDLKCTLIRQYYGAMCKADTCEQNFKDLDFYAAHLEPGEKYRLGEKELNRIGIIRSTE